MIITYNVDRKRFEAQTNFHERNTANPLLKGAGFAFDWDTKTWHTAGYRLNNPYLKQVEIASKLMAYLDGAAKTKIVNDDAASRVAIDTVAAEITKADSLEASRATDADIVIPVPEGIDPSTGKPYEYLPYQKAGIAYALKRENTLIGDEMGLGKTIQGIGVSNASPEIKNVLIVCPASLKLMWDRKWPEWDVKHLSVGVVEGNEVPDTDVVIVNYDILDRNANAFRARTWDLLIVDECHKVKNPKALRTQFLLGKYTWIPEERRWNVDIQPIAAKRRVFLTGTPIVNRPVELWPIIRTLDPQGLGKYKSKFEQRYCALTPLFKRNGEPVMVRNRKGEMVQAFDKNGASNLPELQERMRTSFLVRRLKADVLKDLPPKRREIVVLEPGVKVREAVKRERAVYDSLQAAGLNSVKTDFAEMTNTRQEVARAKLPYVIEEVREALEAVDKLVVMAHHKLVVEALAREFPDISVVVNSDVSIEDRQVAVDAFQTDPNIKLFIGSIQAAGVGLTLTAASNIIFAELDWVPGNVSQAEDRCHRIGQVNPVLIKYLVFDKSADADMAQKLVSKESVITAGLDTPTQKQVQMPEVGIVEPPKPTTKIKVEGVEKEVAIETLIDSDTTVAIHNAIKFLASRCDGAFSEDSAGFNKLDTQFGHDLANRYKLTPKQALAAQKLVRKYRRQLPEPMLTAAGIGS